MSQPYMQKLLAMARRGELDRPGEVAKADVLHDDCCLALHGGLCCCEPDITIHWQTEAGHN